MAKAKDSKPVAEVLRLPYPPSANTMWRHVGPKVLLSAEGRRYRAAVAVACTEAKLRGTLKLFLGPARVQVWLFPPDRRKRDIDNPIKAMLDALQHAGVFADDNAVCRLEVTRSGVRAGGMAEVVISPYGEPEGA